MASRLLICLLLLGCSRQPPLESNPEAAASAKPEKTDCETLFEPPEGADLLCDQHDLATDAEVHWRSFGSRDERSALEARYRGRAERCGAEVRTEPSGLTLGKGPFRLSLHDASPKSYPGCEKSPSGEHRTVVLISSMFRR